MTEETKKLFGAPWKRAQNLSRNGSGTTRGPSPSRIVDASNNPVAYAYPTLPKGKQKVTANRIARLPELYDALVETVYYKCFECMGGLRHNIALTREELVNGCPKQNKSNVCIYVKHIELLRKVREGK